MFFSGLPFTSLPSLWMEARSAGRRGWGKRTGGTGRGMTEQPPRGADEAGRGRRGRKSGPRPRAPCARWAAGRAACSLTPCLGPLPSSSPGVGLQGLPDLPLCRREQAIGTMSCRVGCMSYFLREGRRLPHPVSLQTSGNVHTSWFSVSGPNLPLPSATPALPTPFARRT